MNRTRLIFIGFLALGLGLLASAWVYRNLQERSGSQVRTQEVMVAAADISVGSRIQEKDVRAVQIAVDATPPGAFGSTRHLVGRGVIVPIAQGEFFISGKNLASESAGAGVSSLIPPGMRAVSVRVGDGSVVGGFIQPRSRVDVLLTGTSATGEALSQTVLRNIEVLANGTRLDRNATPTDAQNSPLITLLVSPDDAEKLALATAQGRIQLALRNPLDTGQNDIGAVGMHTFYPNQKPAPPLVAHRPKPAPVIHASAPVPSSYPVEVIKGDKKEVTNLSD